MRGLLFVIVIAALGIATCAFAWPDAFQRMDPIEIGWAAALLAMGAVIALRLTGRPADGIENGESIPSALSPRALPSFVHGLAYAVIWGALLLALVAAYSLSEWAGNFGQMLGALFNS